MLAAALLIMCTSSPLPGQLPGAPGAPPGVERERHRTAPPPPSTPELRKLEGLRARFEFARETHNQGSLQVIDAELLTLLAQLEKPVLPSDAEPLPQGTQPAEKPGARPITQSVLDVKGKYDEPSLNVRRKVLNTLLAKAMADAGANQPAAEGPGPEQDTPRPRRRGRN